MSDQTEYLDASDGLPLPPAPPTPRRSGRRVALLAGTGVGLLALGGAGAWAFMSLSGGGPQPAEALPASTWAYLSVDLDPSAGQKVESISTLNKFPALKEQMGVNPDDDLIEQLVEQTLKDDPCAHFSYADDLKPWLGQRFAVAMVDLGKDQAPVAVLQVTDERAAADGLRAVAACAAHADAERVDGVESTWVVADGWAYVAEDLDTAQRVLEATESGTLADSAEYTAWMDRVGERGIVTMYAAPAAGQHLADVIEEMAGAEPAQVGDVSMLGLADQVTEQLAEFPGMAATLRFHDGGMELEAVGAPSGSDPTTMMSTGAGEAVATLPDDTLAGLGMSLRSGWLDAYAERIAGQLELIGEARDLTGEQLLAELEKATGLSLPEDIETLTGSSFALAVGGDLDMDQLANSADGSDVPIGYKVRGTPDDITAVLDKLRRVLGPGDSLLGSTVEGDVVAVGPNPVYRADLAAGGALGDSAVFRDVVPHADKASMVLFVDFDAGSNWLAELAQSDPEERRNLEPLSALGVSVWQDAGTAHTLLRLTTD